MNHIKNIHNFMVGLNTLAPYLDVDGLTFWNVQNVVMVTCKKQLSMEENKKVWENGWLQLMSSSPDHPVWYLPLEAE